MTPPHIINSLCSHGPLKPPHGHTALSSSNGASLNTARCSTPPASRRQTPRPLSLTSLSKISRVRHPAPISRVQRTRPFRLRPPVIWVRPSPPSTSRADMTPRRIQNTAGPLFFASFNAHHPL
ncbi:hypothetical protein HYPSUDRAFT_209830 [Hypholoma sublateritium FD-334 SS-4]|uniref:Uncharacterized protein n=1 Tax=Hypholoma sublateritium (strain FD-334 SS-4) TaxID=945553 RepID=A0A0D2LQL0_HYPSF|nr:hypothetical protein HYPSUDRAFT_209830 [Hypholoma sublateritium FD-334 SS-4]